MTKIQNWPHWLQLLVGIPYGVLGIVLVYVWWPKTTKGLVRFLLLGLFYVVFYLIFIP